MKKIVMILAGVLLGITLIMGVFFVLNLNLTREVVGLNTTIEQDVAKDSVGKEAAVLPLRTIAGLNDTVVYVEESTYSEEDIMQASATYRKKPYYIKVNRQANCVTVYGLDAEGEYTIPFKVMVCSVGKDGATPLGVFKISSRYEWRLLFGDTYGQYSVRFNGHILFHSVHCNKFQDIL